MKKFFRLEENPDSRPRELNMRNVGMKAFSTKKW